MLDRQEARIWPVTLPQIETTVCRRTLAPAEFPETSMANASADNSRFISQST